MFVRFNNISNTRHVYKLSKVTFGVDNTYINIGVVYNMVWYKLITINDNSYTIVWFIYRHELYNILSVFETNLISQMKPPDECLTSVFYAILFKFCRYA